MTAQWRNRQNGTVTSTVPDRIARRYPTHRGRRLAIIIVCVALAVAGGAWLLWAATIGANPPVSGQVSGFDVISDSEVRVELVVERPAPEQAAVCTIIAQSVSYERVGEVVVQVAPGTETRHEQTVTIRTFKRATSASLDGCRPA